MTAKTSVTRPLSLPAEWAEAYACLQTGRLHEAQEIYARICRREKGNVDAWMMHGIVNERLGLADEAVQCYQRATRLDPEQPEIHCRLASLLLRLRRPAEAAGHYQEALHRQPDLTEAHHGLGQALWSQGNIEDAIACFRQALARQPDAFPVLAKLGVLLRNRGDLQEAEDCFRQVWEHQPDDFFSGLNLGSILTERGNPEAGLELLEQAVRRQPDNFYAHLNYGMTLAAVKRFQDADDALAHAQAIDPQRFDAYRAHNLPKPIPPDALSRRLYVIQWLDRLRWCDWNHYDTEQAALRALTEMQLADANPPYPPSLDPFNIMNLFPDPALQLAVATAHSQYLHQYTEATRRACAFSHARTPPAKLRIGYVSPDFRNHPVFLLIKDIFRCHDRRQIEIVGYSLYPRDDGRQERAIIQNVCDQFVDISRLSDHEAAQRIHQDDIHILVDLAGYMDYGRPSLFALRPAPIQVSYIGFTGSQGAPWMDYLIATPLLVPPAQERFYQEQIVRLPDIHTAVSGFPQAPDIPRRADEGLPEHGFVFCCLARGTKLEPIIFRTWLAILRRTPGSVLWLYAHSSEITHHLRRYAESHGVAPDRLIFASRVELPRHLARLRLADLWLDTHIFGGFTTVLQALWAGLPVLTCLGPTFASRQAATAVAAAGLPQTIVSDLHQYEGLAVHYASAPNALDPLRAQLGARRATAPAFNPEGVTRHLETAYRLMWERYERGQPPEPITVPRSAESAVTP